MSILALREVHRVHGSGETAVHALRGVTLTADEGELVAVMGPSGSGKSTLLNLAGGLDRPTRGEVAVDGTVLGRCSRRALAALRRRRVGYVFQDLNLLPLAQRRHRPAGRAPGGDARRRPAHPLPATDRTPPVAAGQSSESWSPWDMAGRLPPASARTRSSSSSSMAAR
jgi:hypothetical protein